jgi:hypothetical protein
MIEGVLVNAAKKRKEGPLAKSGLLVPEHSILEYEGPRTSDELWEAEIYSLRKPVKVNGSKVMRTRPMFENWALVATVDYDPEVIGESYVDDWMRIAGPQVGLGDWRPRYGRFVAERLNGV